MHALLTILKSPIVRQCLAAIYILFLLSVTSLYVQKKTAKDQIMKIRVDKEKTLSFDEASSLARRFDRMTDKIDETDWNPVATDEKMSSWVLEITPMFMYEGLARQTDSDFDFFVNSLFDGFEHNHIAGRSDCSNYAYLNARYRNDVSGWYQNKIWPVVFAHELAHVQQGQECDREYNSSDILENSAQIMAWEVMAALSNQGSKEAVLSLVHELRGSALSASAAMAFLEGRSDDYAILLKDIYDNDSSSIARQAKGMRYWSDDIEELNILRMRYSWTPLNLVFEARNEGTIYQLAIRNDTHSAEIDDLLYFIEHMEELVDWAIEETDDE